MAGRYPSPASQRRNRSAPRVDWHVLPAEGRTGPAPTLPDWIGDGLSYARELVVAWWLELWSTPQATMWDQSGRTLHRLAQLKHDLIAANDLGVSERARLVATLSAEMRQIEDRHGLSPKSMLQLRWMIAPAEAGEGVTEGVTEVAGEGDASPGPGGTVTAMPGVDLDAELEPPRKNAGLDVWREWALLCGATEGQIDGLGRNALVEVYADKSPGAAPPTPRSSAAVERLKRKR